MSVRGFESKISLISWSLKNHLVISSNSPHIVCKLIQWPIRSRKSLKWKAQIEEYAGLGID